MTRSQTCHITA